MTLTIQLTPEEEKRLNVAAARQGMATEELALKAVKDLIPPDDIQEKLAKLRTILDIGDEDEQRETGEYLRRVLAESR